MIPRPALYLALLLPLLLLLLHFPAPPGQLSAKITSLAKQWHLLPPLSLADRARPPPRALPLHARHVRGADR